MVQTLKPIADDEQPQGTALSGQRFLQQQALTTAAGPIIIIKLIKCVIIVMVLEK